MTIVCDCQCNCESAQPVRRFTVTVEVEAPSHLDASVAGVDRVCRAINKAIETGVPEDDEKILVALRDNCMGVGSEAR